MGFTDHVAWAWRGVAWRGLGERSPWSRRKGSRCSGNGPDLTGLLAVHWRRLEVATGEMGGGAESGVSCQKQCGEGCVEPLSLWPGCLASVATCRDRF